MKRSVLPLFLALLSLPALAQHTYTIVGGPYRSSYLSPFLETFAIQLTGTGNAIGVVRGSVSRVEWSCGNGKPSQGGMINYTINSIGQPCANSTSYVESGTVTMDDCTGPFMGIETFDDGSTLTVYFRYDDDKSRYDGVCERKIFAGQLVTAQ